MTYVDEVRAPVLIIQGRTHPDAGAPRRALRRAPPSRAHPVEIEWFDAGHMGGGDELAIEHQALMHAFAGRVVGRRHAQKSSPSAR